MHNINEIKRRLQKLKLLLKRQYGVREIGLFGSYVRGDQEKLSDIDIVVEYYKVPSLLKFLELENYLTDTLGIKVDLVRKEAIRTELKKAILAEVVLI